MARIKLFSVSIEDCRVECIASTGGAGGQNKNRRHTAVRITHPPSGAVGYSADEREQRRNKVAAFTRLARHPLFTSWVAVERHRLMGGLSVSEQVEEMMAPENLKVEIQKDGKWTLD